MHLLDTSECVSMAFVVNEQMVKSGKLRSAKDLAGKVIASDRTLSASYIYDLLLAKDGLSLDDVTLVDVPNPAKPEGLRRGTIDLSLLAEPQLSLAIEEGGLVSWIPAYDVLPNTPYTYMLYGPSLLEQRPEVGKRFMTAYLRGVAQYRQGKTPRNIEILAKVTTLTPDFLRRVCWPPAEPFGAVRKEYFSNLQAWYMSQQIVDKQLPTEEVWDSRFVDYATEILKREQKSGTTR
jgi:NitT/TauT family transport system substrate-binding protein